MVLALTGIGSPLHAVETEANSKGAWVNLPKDGTPWKHPGTDLIFPQLMGDFSLNGGYLDKLPGAGVAITYSHPKLPLKADIVIAPCREQLAKTPDVMKVARDNLEKLAADLLALSKAQGYTEAQRSPIDEQRLPLWETSDIPFVSQTVELAPSSPAGAKLSSLNQWLAVLIYKDHFVQINVIMPSAVITSNKADADQLITNILQCIRYPTLKPQMLEVCRTYAAVPLTDDGRKAADALLAFSKESPVFEIIFPGEALTSFLDEIGKQSQTTSLDFLRAFIVGSGVVTLQNGMADESLEEGARMMIVLRDMLKEKSTPVESTFLDDLAKASSEQKAAAFLRQRMSGSSK